MEYDEPKIEITQEQQAKFDLLKKLSASFDEQLKNMRKKAMDSLLDNTLSPLQKSDELEQFFKKRLNPDELTIAGDYSITSLEQLADELFRDQTFIYSDCAFVIDALDYFKDTFSLEDEILAYHFFRLNKSDKALSLLVYILSVYLSKSLRLDVDTFSCTPVLFDYSQEECLALLKKLSSTVNDHLVQINKNSNKTNKKLTLDPEECNLRLSDRIDAGFFCDIGTSFLEPSELDIKYDNPNVLKCSPEKIKQQQKEFEAQQEIYYLDKSIRSIYLLWSVLMEIGEEHFDSEFIKIYRSNANCFLNDNYSESVDVSDDIKGDKRLMGQLLQSEEDKASKEHLSMLIDDELSNYNTVTELLIHRRELLFEARGWLSEPYRSEVENKISQKIIDDSVQHSFQNISIFIDAVRCMFGDKASLLDASIIKTLATAELLYDEYAIKNPQDGFDYSGISALYYQSFEKSYNQLIWRKIAKHYNSLLQENYQSNISTISQDFPPPIHNKHYFDFDKSQKVYSIKKTCMYGPFSRLIKFLSPKSNGKLLDIVLNILNQEYSETFQKKLQFFSDHVEKTTENRNNACHGTMQIDIQQCAEDKIEVLTEMRKENIGLVAQLLDLFA